MSTNGAGLLSQPVERAPVIMEQAACSRRRLLAAVAAIAAGGFVSFQPRDYVQPLIDQGLLVALESQPAMPRLTYNLVWRRDDDRELVRTVVGLVQDEADFGAANVLWGAMLENATG